MANTDLSSVHGPVGKLGPALAALTPSTPMTPTRQERVATALETLGQSGGAANLRAAAQAAWRTGRASYTSRERIQLNPDLSQQARDRQLAEHDARYENTTLVGDLQSMKDAIDWVRGLILSVAPDFPPTSAIDAARINGIVADFDGYDPVVAVRVAREAIARKDLPLCKRLRDKLEGLRGWKKPFPDSRDVHAVLEELADLLATEDVIRSDAAKEWVEAAERNAKQFIRELANGHGKVDPIFITVGALPTLFNAPPGLRTLSADDVASLT